MKKLFLTVIGWYVGLLAAFSQPASQTDSLYKKRKLTFEEANLISSYYSQRGDNAAVTGGIGSQKLTDIANTFDIKYSKYDRKNRKHTFTGEIGVDHYTSASSDKVDPATISSASAADTRFYPSINWSVENLKKNTYGAGISFSVETDYVSFGANLNAALKNKKGGTLLVSLKGYRDRLLLIHPIELRADPSDGKYGKGGANRNTINGGLSWAQVINERFQVLIAGEVTYQQGYLGLPFHRVYFKDNSVHIENLPSTRLKIPLGFRANYFAGDKLVIRTWYRYYRDDWGIHSNAFQLEPSVKVTPFFSIAPFYRYYQQSAADYFQPFRQHTAADLFFTSNYDLSRFSSDFFGAGLRVAPPGGILNISRFNSLEIRYGHYQKRDGFRADIVSLHVKWK